MASRQVDDDAMSDGFDLPEYADQQAQHEEDNGTAMSDDERSRAPKPTGVMSNGEQVACCRPAALGS